MKDATKPIIEEVTKEMITCKSNAENAIIGGIVKAKATQGAEIKDAMTYFFIII